MYGRCGLGAAPAVYFRYPWPKPSPSHQHIVSKSFPDHPKMTNPRQAYIPKASQTRFQIASKPLTGPRQVPDKSPLKSTNPQQFFHQSLRIPQHIFPNHFQIIDKSLPNQRQILDRSPPHTSPNHQQTLPDSATSPPQIIPKPPPNHPQIIPKATPRSAPRHPQIINRAPPNRSTIDTPFPIHFRMLPRSSPNLTRCHPKHPQINPTASQQRPTYRPTDGPGGKERRSTASKREPDRNESKPIENETEPCRTKTEQDNKNTEPAPIRSNIGRSVKQSHSESQSHRRVGRRKVDC